VAQTIIITRTGGRTPMPAQQELENLARSQATLCIFLSGHKIEEVVGALTASYGGDCPCAVVYHASWPDQKIIEGALEDIAGKVRDTDIGQTSVIIVGRALGRDIPASKLYDAAFTHKYREGKES
jgi:precorrin-4/cobalt-precorrin-4 C11-methyltransferase